MREHPEYKYRPRRKPKPLVKKDGTSKYGFPLPFFPPGIDPIMAARSFAFSPHYAAALAAATAFSAHSTPGNNAVSANELINPFASIPVPTNPVHSTLSPSNTVTRILGENDSTSILKNKSNVITDANNPFSLYPPKVSLNSQEGFLEFVQKYQIEHNVGLASSNKVASNVFQSPSKINDISSINKEMEMKTNEKVEEENREGDDDGEDESMEDDSDEDEVLDVDGNEAGHPNATESSNEGRDGKDFSISGTFHEVNEENHGSPDNPGKCSQRSPSCPDSTTSPSFVNEKSEGDKTQSRTLDSKTESSKTKSEFSPAESKSEMKRPFAISPKTTHPVEAKLRVPNYLNANVSHHLMEKNIYTNPTTTSIQQLNGNIPSMSPHTSPVALHLLSSYIAAGLVPQIPGNPSLITSQAAFEPINPTGSVQNTSGIGFQSISNLMTTSAATNILYSQSKANGSIEQNSPISSLTNQDLNRSLSQNMIIPTLSGFSTNIGLHLNTPSTGISSLANRSTSNDIKRPIPHLPQKSSGIGIS